jgi:hypothetical protein
VGDGLGERPARHGPQEGCQRRVCVYASRCSPQVTGGQGKARVRSWDSGVPAHAVILRSPDLIGTTKDPCSALVQWKRVSLRSNAGILCKVYPEPLRCHPERSEGSAVGSGAGKNFRFLAEFTLSEMTRLLRLRLRMTAPGRRVPGKSGATRVIFGLPVALTFRSAQRRNKKLPT